MDKYNVNSNVTNYSDFCNNWESEKEKLKKTKRSFTSNTDRQQFVRNSRTEFNPVTRKLTDYTEDEIQDILFGLCRELTNIGMFLFLIG